VKRTEKEIEFYKDLFGKVYTALLLAITGAVTTAFHYGVCGWSIAGLFLSFHLAVTFVVVGIIYKRKIDELEDTDEH